MHALHYAITIQILCEHSLNVFAAILTARRLSALFLYRMHENAAWYETLRCFNL